LIDWCLKPTLALFQQYSGVDNDISLSSINFKTNQIWLEIFFKKKRLLYLSCQEISSILYLEILNNKAINCWTILYIMIYNNTKKNFNRPVASHWQSLSHDASHNYNKILS
jgi:hypothetical protein